MNYYEIKIFTTTEGIEPLATILTMLGHETFVTEDKSTVEEFLDKKNTYDWDYVSQEVLSSQYEESNITLYLEPATDTLAQISELENAVAKLKQIDDKGLYGRLVLESRLVCDDDWKDKWKEYFKPAKITNKIIVKPSWETYEAGAGEKIIEIDPGMAFGTGTHPTTKMCIQMLEEYIDSDGDTVIDLGCGSGILSIAAILCGCKNVKGVDIDPDAVEATKENLIRNNISDCVEVFEGDVTKGLGLKGDIIAANLMAEMIVMLLPDIARHLSGKKIFISSGILTEKKMLVSNALTECGFEIIEIKEEDGWCAIAAKLK